MEQPPDSEGASACCNRVIVTHVRQGLHSVSVESSVVEAVRACAWSGVERLCGSQWCSGCFYQYGGGVGFPASGLQGSGVRHAHSSALRRKSG